MKRISWLWVFFLCTMNHAYSQNKAKLDSLKAVLETSMADTQKVNTYNALIYAYKRSDSLEITHYALLAIALAQKAQYPKGLVETYDHLASLARRKTAYSKANKIYQLMLETSKKYNYLKGEASAYLGFGFIQKCQSNHDQALVYYEKSLKISQTIKDQPRIAKVYHRLGTIFYYQSNYAKTLEYYHKALKITEKLGNKRTIGGMHNNIGAVYLAQGHYNQALKQFFKALQIQKQMGNKFDIGASYNNINLIYLEQGNFKKAMEYLFKSLKIFEELDRKPEMAINYGNLGLIYHKQKKYALAQDYFGKALKINLGKTNKSDIANDYYNIGTTYLAQTEYVKARSYLHKSLNISLKIGNKSITSGTFIALGQTYKALKNYPKAIIYLNKGIALATKTGNPVNTKDGYETLAQVHRIQGDYKAAFEAHVLFKQMADSLLNNENTNKMIRLEADYAFKIEKDSLKLRQVALNTQLEKEKLTSSFRRNFSILASLGLIAMMVLAFFIYRSRQQQKRSNVLLTQQKKALREQSEELLATNEELKQSEEEVTSQRDNIEEKNMLLSTQHHQLTQSVKAAFTIQKAILPSEKRLVKEFDEHFVIYRPKDVVSGDFYWVGKIHNKRIVGAIDCTGHGVPGAFMSMIGFTLLNDIIKTKQETNPAQILERLRIRVARVLNQQESGNNSGMDAAFVVLEAVENEEVQVSFAGAKRPLWYIMPNGSGLEIIKGDRVSIGFAFGQSRAITHHTIRCKKGTLLYLSSDGFVDQNNATQMKFGSENLQKLVHQNHELSLAQQKQVLEDALSNHMKNTEQRDDILWMGLKV